jgi:anthranilate phosphoribosyltransferase
LNSFTTEILGQVSSGTDLTAEQMEQAIGQMMRGEWSEEEMGLLLVGLATKGEAVSELVGAAAAMRKCMVRVRTSRAGLLDTCGTGGGGSRTFNVSTTAAIVAAAAGVPVAKHGNRSITSCSGSADVLALLGVNLEASREQVEKCLDELGICFCFAPLAHPAMRHVGPVRKKLGRATIFNLLGPLANPAGAEYQVLGVVRPEIESLMAEAARQLGTRRTLVVRGEDGVGDVSCSGPTHVTIVTPDSIETITWLPGDFGLECARVDDLEVSGPEQSAAVVRQLLQGEPGPPRTMVLLNAAAALIAAGAETDLRAAAERAREAIDSGAARTLLDRLADLSHRPAQPR